MGETTTGQNDLVQREVEALAPGLGLRLESPACDEGPRTVGVAFVCIKPLVSAKLAGPSPAGSNEDAAIQEMIQGYESLGPENFAQDWRKFTTDPHVGFGLSWLGLVDEQAVQSWLTSDALAKALAAYPLYSPRRIRLSNVSIVYIGQSRAAVTYRVEEDHRNGAITAGNSVALLLKVDGAGWRIATATKGGRGEPVAAPL